MSSIYIKRKKQEDLKRRLAECRCRLEMYLDAEKAILEGAQSYSLGTRQISRASLGQVQQEIEALYKKIDELEAQIEGKAARKAFAVVPRDY